MTIATPAPFMVMIGVALLGYVATNLNNLRIAQRKDRLDRKVACGKKAVETLKWDC